MKDIDSLTILKEPSDDTAIPSLVPISLKPTRLG